MLSWNYKWHVKLSGNSLNLAESQSAESHQRKSSQQLHFVRSFVRSRNEARGFTVDDFRPRAQNSRTSKWTWNIFGTFQWTIPIEEWLKLQLWTLCPAEFKGKKNSKSSQKNLSAPKTLTPYGEIKWFGDSKKKCHPNDIRLFFSQNMELISSIIKPSMIWTSSYINSYS